MTLPTIEERLAEAEHRLSAIEHGLGTALVRMEALAETRLKGFLERMEALVETLPEKILDRTAGIVEVPTRLTALLYAAIADKGLLGLEDLLALVKEEKVTQAEIEALTRLWRHKPGGGTL